MPVGNSAASLAASLPAVRVHVHQWEGEGGKREGAKLLPKHADGAVLKA